MINGFHTIIYSDDAVATRAFFHDILQWPSIDAGGGWLIFNFLVQIFKIMNYVMIGQVLGICLLN